MREKPIRKKIIPSASTKELIVPRKTNRNHSSNENHKERKRFSCFKNKYVFFGASAFLFSSWYFLSQTGEDESDEKKENRGLKQLSKHDLALSKILNHSFKLYLEENPRESINYLLKYLNDFPELKDIFTAFDREDFATLKTLSESLFSDKLHLHDIYNIIKSDMLSLLDQKDEAIALLKHTEKNSNNPPLKLLAKLKLAENDSNLSQEQKQKIMRSLTELIISSAYCQNITDTTSSLNTFLKRYVGLPTENGSVAIKDYFNLPQSPDNFVIVRIWLKKGDFGHVSVETKKNYMSFWPEKKNYTQTSVPGVWKTLENDLRSYSQLPECKIKLETLNGAKIDEVYSEMKISNSRWSLLPITENHHHCAIMSYYLLYEGGITNYISALPTYQVERGLNYLDKNFGPAGSITINLLQGSIESFSFIKSIAFYPWYLPIHFLPIWVLANSPSFFMKSTNHLWHNPQYLMIIASLAKYLEMDNLSQNKNNKSSENTVDSPKKLLGRY